MARYYLGVDWADQSHQLYVSDESGRKIRELEVQQTADGLAELGRWLEESRGQGIELWAAIEKPEGRVVDFLLDHGVVVYPVNPKALDRARDRFRMSPSKNDGFDAYVLAEFLRTDHAHLRALEPNSAEGQELKMLTRDHQRLGRQKTRLLNQIGITLKEYYPVPLEVFESLDTKIALDFLKAYPTPQALSKLTRRGWKRFPSATTTSVKPAVASFGTSSTNLSWRFPHMWSEPRPSFWQRWSCSWRPRLKPSTATARRFKVFSPLCRQLKSPRRCPAEKAAPR